MRRDPAGEIGVPAAKRRAVAVALALALIAVGGCGGGGGGQGGDGVAVGTGEESPTPTTPKAIRLPRVDTKECGDLVESGAGTYDVEAGGVDCGTGREVAQQWEDECASGTPQPCTVSAGFDCSSSSAGTELTRVVCEGPGDQVVLFENGA